MKNSLFSSENEFNASDARHGETGDGDLLIRRTMEPEGPRPAFGPRHGGANGGENGGDEDGKFILYFVWPVIGLIRPRRQRLRVLESSML